MTENNDENIIDVEFEEIEEYVAEKMGQPTIIYYSDNPYDETPIDDEYEDPSLEEVEARIKEIKALPQEDIDEEELKELEHRRKVWKTDISDEALENAYILRKVNTESFTSLAVIAEGTLPKLPTNPNGLVQFQTMAKHAIKGITTLLNKEKKVDPNIRKIRLEYTMKLSEIVLDGELELGKHLKKVSKKQGSRTDIESLTEPSKGDVLEEWGLTRVDASKLERLTTEAIEQAKEYARKKNIPTNVRIAFDFIKQKENKDNTGECEALKETKYEDKHIAFDPKNKPINYTVLFACAGTGEAHLEKHGFNAKVACEYDKKRAELYQSLYPKCKVVQGDVTANIDNIVQLHKDNDCTMLMASPPCQDYTTLGKRDFTAKRAKLYFQMLKIIKKINEDKGAALDYIVIENVKGFLTAKPKELKEKLNDLSVGDYIKKELEDLGYQVNIAIQNGADYGTAQSRERAIFLASKKGLWKFPKKDDKRKMIWEAIGDLPSIEAGKQGYDKDNNPIKFHKAPEMASYDIEAMKHTPTGKSAHYNKKKEWQPKNNAKGEPSTQTKPSSYKRQEWGEVSHTVTTEFGVRGLNTVHPGRPKSDGTYSDARVFTILEVMRLIGLPDDYPIPDDAFLDSKGRHTELLVRDILGECFLPNHVLRLMTTLPR